MLSRFVAPTRAFDDWCQQVFGLKDARAQCAQVLSSPHAEGMRACARHGKRRHGVRRVEIESSTRHWLGIFQHATFFRYAELNGNSEIMANDRDGGRGTEIINVVSGTVSGTEPFNGPSRNAGWWRGRRRGRR